jgi:hypothetical protein
MMRGFVVVRNNRRTGRRRVLFSVVSFLLLLVVFLFFLLLRRLLAARGSRPDPCLSLEIAYPVAPNTRLPRIIHQQWKTEVVPPDYSRWQSRTKAAFANHEYVLWTDESARDMIAKHYPDFLDVYSSLSHHIMRVDAARYFILHRYGGLYLDMDYEVLVNFWDRLPDDVPALIQSYSRYLERTQNSLMSSPPGHALWPIAWDLIARRAESGSTDPIYVTGPRMMDEAIRIYSATKTTGTTSPSSRSGGIRILPCENWQRVTWGEERSAIHTLWKIFAYCVGIFEDCGDVRDSRCQLGIHHGTTMWY